MKIIIESDSLFIEKPEKMKKVIQEYLSSEDDRLILNIHFQICKGTKTKLKNARDMIIDLDTGVISES